MLNYVGGFAYRAVTSGNTQVRRLAYLTAIASLLPSHSTVSIDQGANWLTKWATEHSEDLKEYSRLMDGQGAIVAGRRTGPLRYIDIAQGLLFVSRTGGGISLSPYGELLRLTSKLSSKSNPFSLSLPERLFYTYWLLLTDADHILLVADAASEFKGVRLQNLQSKFKQLFIERLQAKLQVASDARETNRMEEALYRARHQWTTPERYAEHIIPPRANWLLDLGFMEPGPFHRQEYVLSIHGEKFRASLLTISNTGLTDISGDWLWGHIFTTTVKATNSAKDKKYWNELSDEERLQAVKDSITDACKRFPLFGMKACSLLPALVYCAIVLTHIKGILVDLEDLSIWIGEHQSTADFPYEMHLSSLETESYISVVNSFEGNNNV
jgi:hypothetical protein